MLKHLLRRFNIKCKRYVCINTNKLKFVSVYAYVHIYLVQLVYVNNGIMNKIWTHLFIYSIDCFLCGIAILLNSSVKLGDSPDDSLLLRFIESNVDLVFVCICMKLASTVDILMKETYITFVLLILAKWHNDFRFILLGSEVYVLFLNAPLDCIRKLVWGYTSPCISSNALHDVTKIKEVKKKYTNKQTKKHNVLLCNWSNHRCLLLFTEVRIWVCSKLEKNAENDKSLINAILWARCKKKNAFENAEYNQDL